MSSGEPPDRSSVSLAVWLVPAILLLVAVAPLPYGFYPALRFLVCSYVLVLVYHEYSRRNAVSGWVVVLAGMALLFNPLLPVQLTREIWAPIDVGAAIALLSHSVAYRRSSATAPNEPRAAAAAQPDTSPRSPTTSSPSFTSVGPVEGKAHSSTRTNAVERDKNPNALPPHFRLNGYEIVRVLGAGGFGITYLAFDDALNGPVAIKEYFYAGLAARTPAGEVVPASTNSAEGFMWGRNRFLDEARLLARLDHPNIVRTHRFLEANNTAYIVMDYVEGESLAIVLEKHGALTAEQWWPWMKPLLAGLEHVHRHDYLHRDVKPVNIVIRADQQGRTMPVLVDFGSARRAAAEKTRHLTAVHTRGFAPLEQYSTSSRQGPATDIYALAAVSYRVLAGEAPPDATDRAVEDVYRPLVTRLRRPGDRFLAAIDRALALRAAERPQTVAAWRTELTYREPNPRVGNDAPGSTPSWTEMQVLVDRAKRGDTEALERLRQAADQGPSRVQFALAEMYARGKGVARNPVQAAKWYRKAADQGHAEAQTCLGWMYFRGNGMSREFPVAEKWFRAAADQGHARAQFAIGWMLFNGEGTARDPVRAATWFRKAAKQGHEQARNALRACAPTSSRRLTRSE